MRSGLNTTQDNRIRLEDDSEYSFSVRPFELKNFLGNPVDILDEYVFVPDGQQAGSEYRLYKTKEGNWYDMEEAATLPEKATLRMLKSGIDLMLYTTVSH